MRGKQVAVSSLVGIGLFAALGLGSLGTLVAVAAAGGSGAGGAEGAGALGAMLVGLATMLLLLLLGPLEGLVVGAVIGLRHRGSWKEALPAGLLAGAFGFLLQAALVTLGLASALRVLGLPREAGPVPLLEMAILAVPSGILGAVAATVAASAFGGPRTARGEGPGPEEVPVAAPAAPSAPAAVARAAPSAAPGPAAAAALPDPAAILGAAPPSVPTGAAAAGLPAAAAMASPPAPGPRPSAGPVPAAPLPATPPEPAKTKPSWAP